MSVSEADVNRVLAGQQHAKDATNFANSVKFEVQQQTDGSYKFVISEQYNGMRWNRNE